MVSYKQYKQIKRVFFKAIMTVVVTETQHSFVDWFELQAQVSHFLVDLPNRKGGSYLYYHFKISQRNNLDPKGWQEFCL